MPFAAEGWIGWDRRDGAIEITPEQYAEGLDGILAGRMISVENGFAIVEPPASEPPAAVTEAAALPIEDQPPHNGDVDAEQGRRLGLSDFYFVRAQDPSDGRPVPDEIVAARRVIRAGGSALRAMDPIPLDYRDDKYWLSSA